MLKLVSAAGAGFGITHSDHPRVIEMEVERRRLAGIVTMGRLPARGG